MKSAVLCNAMRTASVARGTIAILLAGVSFSGTHAWAWGAKGHKTINRLAMMALPATVPEFLRSQRAIREVEYLGPEPDRWRDAKDLNSAQAAEHFIDLERADIAAPSGLPEQRFDFLRDLCEAQAGHPGEASEFTPEKVGLLPWQANEWFERLEVDLWNYRMRRASGGNTWPIQQAVLYDIGILGHYVGDGSQPLHTSIDYDGWAEKSDPEGFTRRHGIHSQFETEFVDRNIRAATVQPLISANARFLREPFRDFATYLRASHGQVKEVYRLQKAGGFDGTGTAESRRFTRERLAAGASMLRDMIYTAWMQSRAEAVN